jgi:LytS/YehU family sensor histidine kinase
VNNLRGPLSFFESLLFSTLVFGSWVPFALIVASRARPLPTRAPERGRVVVVWLVASLGIAALHVVTAEVLVVASSAARNLPVGDLSRSLEAAFRMHYHESLFLTLATVACAIAVREYEAAREHEVRLTRAREELTTARLNMLRYQMQPHFLFNALNSISAEVYSDPHRADRMICSLSDFLRRSLDPGDQAQIPLEEELDLANRYLEVERFRFGSRLVFRREIESGLERAAIPPLLLQPLVENSVRHGVARSLEPVTIEISATHTGDQLVLKVVDDAAPFESGGETHAGQGLGLANSRRRLAQIYGGRASLWAGRRDGRGFEVVLRMPFLEIAPESLHESNEELIGGVA